jgi:ATP-dependent Clp protease ATP-binding subunit ClpA
MFERFTDNARQTLVRAQAEARALSAGEIGTEHVLLGLVTEGGVAAAALAELGVTEPPVRQQVEQSARPVPGASQSLPFAPEAAKAIQGSLTQALDLGDGYIGTGHLLLSLLGQDHCQAAQILIELGVTAGPVRDHVARLAEPGLTDEQPPLIAGAVAPLTPARRRRWRR